MDDFIVQLANFNWLQLWHSNEAVKLLILKKQFVSAVACLPDSIIKWQTRLPLPVALELPVSKQAHNLSAEMAFICRLFTIQVGQIEWLRKMSGATTGGLFECYFLFTGLVCQGPEAHRATTQLHGVITKRKCVIQRAGEWWEQRKKHHIMFYALYLLSISRKDRLAKLHAFTSFSLYEILRMPLQGKDLLGFSLLLGL